MVKTLIVPGILEKNFSKIEKNFKLVEKDFLEIQLDICDGNFVKSKTFLYSNSKKDFEKIKKVSKNFNLEIDLMCDLLNDKKILKWLENLIFLNPKRIIFHFGSTNNFDLIFEKLRNTKIKIGLGILNSNNKREVSKILLNYKFDFIQIMGINKIGVQGEGFTTKTFKIFEYYRNKFSKLEIDLDGGVKITNYKKINKIKFFRAVMGSQIFKGDYKKNLKDIKSLK